MNELDILLRMLAAMAAGALIGLERSYRGRAAGLRTYTLVALGSSLLVASVQYADNWAPIGTGDPTRVVQGIVTGIGFLGAGVIIREGFSVRGLTTAASIWAIAVIGVVFGEGHYKVAAAATLFTWVALELLRQLESRMPTHSLVHCDVAFARANAWNEETVRTFVERQGFTIGEISNQLDASTQIVGYELVMWSVDAKASECLSRALLGETAVLGFRVAPARD